MINKEIEKLEKLGKSLKELLENSDLNEFTIMKGYEFIEFGKRNPQCNMDEIKKTCFIDIFKGTYYLGIFSWDTLEFIPLV